MSERGEGVGFRIPVKENSPWQYLLLLCVPQRRNINLQVGTHNIREVRVTGSLKIHPKNKPW